ncbi:hypothetical protein Clacol_001103 [Clathrus columnatus]|uniref:Uncharacterized protein n=1 Tax=Clathrus columnatus TaxID=1419009 RepID=A0AAV5A045_9AGAM|nr:hypothetical protein Clacol_001103 [Clathrus columnatus]
MFGSFVFVTLFSTIHNIAIVCADVLAFVAVIHQVWGLWKLKRSLGLESNKDVATILLRQCILRFCFVLGISTTQLLFAFDVADTFNPIQNILSALLLCEFTLDLRRRNTTKSASNQTAFDLPTISFQENPVESVRSVLGRHESIVTEMGERIDLVDRWVQDDPTPVHGERDGLQEGLGATLSDADDSLESDYSSTINTE